MCRRRGVAIIARRVQPGIEQSEVLEGLGCETTIRKSPDARRLQNSGRADSETEVLLLAPKPSDVRRHSDVPLRDIAKFQASVSAATSQHDLGLSLTVGNMGGEKARSSNDIILQKGEGDSGGANISISISTPSTTKKPLPGEKQAPQQGKDKAPVKASGKGAPMKRQRSYERGASEGALNLPANARGRRASCDMRGMDATSLLNNNTIQQRADPKGVERASAMGIPGLSEKDLQRLQFQHQQHLQQQNQRDQKPSQQQPKTPVQQQPKTPVQQQPKTPVQQQYQPPQQQQQYQPNQQQQQYQTNQQQTQQYQSNQQQQYQPPQQQQQQYQPSQQQQQQYQPSQQQQPQYQPNPQQQTQYQTNPQQHYQQQYQQPQQPQYQQQQPQQQTYQQQQYQQSYQQQQQTQQQNIMGRGKAPPSDLAISPGTEMRRRSVQIYQPTTPKQPPTPRSCASLDAEALQKEKQKQQLQQQQHVTDANGVKRQGSSTDGEAIKIVIDDVDSAAAKAKVDNNSKGQSQQPGGGGQGGDDYRQRCVRLRRDPQDRGYQST